uniref:Putative ovule protein n=1 Tax=Solanum chacoense TaxID=4108 RepID=A0A0V0IV24_SOLCH
MIFITSKYLFFPLSTCVFPFPLLPFSHTIFSSQYPTLFPITITIGLVESFHLKNPKKMSSPVVSRLLYFPSPIFGYLYVPLRNTD